MYPPNNSQCLYAEKYSIFFQKLRIKMAGGKAGKDTGKTKQKAVSRSARAGLQFPVGRLMHLFVM